VTEERRRTKNALPLKAYSSTCQNIWSVTKTCMLSMLSSAAYSMQPSLFGIVHPSRRGTKLQTIMVYRSTTPAAGQHNHLRVSNETDDDEEF
jgi:hypothetical protein